MPQRIYNALDYLVGFGFSVSILKFIPEFVAQNFSIKGTHDLLNIIMVIIGIFFAIIRIGVYRQKSKIEILKAQQELEKMMRKKFSRS